MRPLELSTVLLSAYTLCHGTGMPWTRVAAYLLLGSVGAHLLVEQPRWQLIPLYLLVTVLVYSILLNHSSSSSGTPAWPASRVFVCLAVLALLSSCALATLFPVAPFPHLNGPYRSVGVVTRYIPTQHIPGAEVRVPEGVQAPQHHPVLGVSVFYPAGVEATGQPGAPFLSSAVLAGLSTFLELPGALFSYVTLGRLRAVPDLPMVSPSHSPSKLPVLVFSHGLGGVAHMYASQASELASQGYVVFVPTHNDGSACLAELPEGVNVPFANSALPYEKLLALRQSQLLARAAEVHFIIDFIEHAEKNDAWNVSVPFAGRLDLSRVGMLGHSFGGATASLVSARDSRIRALVAHDAWMLPVPEDVATGGLQRPVPALLTMSEIWSTDPNLFDPLVDFARPSLDATMLVLNGTGHSNFSDVPMFSQMLSRFMKQLGELDFYKVMDSINRAQVEFLHRHLDHAHADTQQPTKHFDQLIRNKEAKLIVKTKQE